MKIPYQMTAAVNDPMRHAQMSVAILMYNWPRLQQVPIDESKIMTIACYGPSLKDTYKDMQRPIMSMSGATQWLAEHGVIADYHVDMDPRPNKVSDVTPIIPGVKYIMATICHPSVFESLKKQGADVTLWHVYSSPYTYEFVKNVDPGQNVVTGCSTIGNTSLHLAGVMGYRHLEIHGMDGSFDSMERRQRHAGPHTGTKQNKDGIVWPVYGVKYATSRIMANGVAETLNHIQNYPMFCVFHGHGLTQQLIRKRQFPNACCADETEKAEFIRKAKVHIADTLIVDQNDARLDMGKLWDTLCPALGEHEIEELKTLRTINEARRKVAKYNTGTVTLEQMIQLRGLSRVVRPRTVLEVGTFIGNSTMAIQAKHIYTVDRDNDCLPGTEIIHPFPGKDSTYLLAHFIGAGIKADLIFLDGRLEAVDAPLLRQVITPETVFVFDDYTGTSKGVLNARLAATVVNRDWILLEPDLRIPNNTLAALVPRKLLGLTSQKTTIEDDGILINA